MANRHKKLFNNKIKAVLNNGTNNSAKGAGSVRTHEGNKNVLAEARKGLAKGGHIAGGSGGKLGRKRFGFGGKAGADKNPFSSAH